MAQFFEQLGAILGLPASLALPLLLRPGLGDLLLPRLLSGEGQAELFSALLHNTATPTMVRAGDRLNVIPAEAEAELDGRTLPGSSGADLASEVREAIGDDRIEIDVLDEEPPVATDGRSPLIEAIARAVAAEHPGAHVVAAMVPGYTDAKHFHRLGVRWHGFSPVRFEPSSGLTLSRLLHSVDERIPEAGFRWGLRTLYRAVREFSAPSAPI